ncbi:MAG: SpoIIE family protein phosphatase [Bacteroidales bacterium]
MGTSNSIYSILFLGASGAEVTRFSADFGDEFRIHSANTGRQALRLLETESIQVVLCDRDPSDMAWIQVISRIPEFNPDCICMVLSESVDEPKLVEAMQSGDIWRIVRKPWDRAGLKMTIDNAMETYYLKRQNRNLVQYLEEAKQNLERKVMERTREMEMQRDKINDSLQYASRIQKALMLPPEEMDRLLPPHFLLNKPKDIVSGDFYWAARKEGKLVVTVADCTGHGVPGAFMSILGISLLSEVVNGLGRLEAGQVLDELRRQVIRALGQTGHRDEAREGMEMGLCIIDFEHRTLQYSGAFRPLYLISGGKLRIVPGDHMPIGYYEAHPASFRNQEIRFREGDFLYLFTDGYVDQMGGLKRKTFRSARFRELLLEIQGKPLTEQCNILREEHEIWRAGREQIDDILILGMKLSQGEDSRLGIPYSI